MAETSVQTIGIRRLTSGLLAILFGAALAAPAQAEDLKGRWYFGGNLSFLSTTDDIRSNAHIIVGPLGDDGIPFTGDPNELQGCVDEGTGTSVNIFCDPRPDDLLSRETAIEETFKYDGTVGFGITSWLSLQLDVSYFKADVGPVDTYLTDAFPISTNPINPTNLNTFQVRQTVIPVQAGEITEIPVSLSGIVRFRKDSPLNPYLGAGIGMIFADMERSGDVDTLNDRIAAMRIRGISNEFNENLVPQGQGSLAEDGRIPFRHALQVNVDDAFEWHLAGGAEYFLNDKMSVVFDARYTFADQNVNIDLAGEDQVNFLIYSEKLFRPDGSLKIFSGCVGGNNCGAAPNPIDPNTMMRISCDSNGPPGDFDNDGNMNGRGGPDLCYNKSIFTGGNTPRGDLIVQGGEIDLTGFSIAVGMRFHF